MLLIKGHTFNVYCIQGEKRIITAVVDAWLYFQHDIPWTNCHDNSCRSIQLVYPITCSHITIFGNGPGYVGHAYWTTL